MKKNVLFVCIHNSARSQMAEEILRQIAGKHLEVESAGLEPGKLNPVVVAVLKEMGINIEGKKTQSVKDVLKKEKTFEYVITVCDEANAERCPTFPGKGQRLHWGFEDPSAFQGTFEEKLAQTRRVRDQIKQQLEQWISIQGWQR
jgi:arsenate reductase